MPRLQILQHKSYHPYLESNKQRVRDDEAKAAALEAEEERAALDEVRRPPLLYYWLLTRSIERYLPLSIPTKQGLPSFALVVALDRPTRRVRTPRCQEERENSCRQEGREASFGVRLAKGGEAFQGKAGYTTR